MPASPFAKKASKTMVHRKKQGDGVRLYVEPLLRSTEVLRRFFSETKKKKASVKNNTRQIPFPFYCAFFLASKQALQ